MRSDEVWPVKVLGRSNGRQGTHTDHCLQHPAGKYSDKYQNESGILRRIVGIHHSLISRNLSDNEIIWLLLATKEGIPNISYRGEPCQEL